MKKIEIPGSLRAEIFAGSPETVLNLCAAEEILIYSSEYKSPCSIELCINQKNEAELREICRRTGAELGNITLRGGRETGRHIKARLPLIIFASLIGILLLISSFFIWDIDIVSDGDIPQGKILNILSKYGLEIGSFWPGLDTDILRAQVLSQCRELSWMTVNVSGSRAQIIINKAEKQPEIFDADCPADILASADGKILSVRVFNGVPRVSPGDEVKKGQLLISSFSESLSNPPRYVRAKGSVLASTEREISSVSPARCLKKTSAARHRSRWALKLGKKRINFYFNSGKYIDGCVKIIKEYNLGVEGLFALPLGLVREELLYFETEEGACLGKKDMEAELMHRLASQTEGEILRTELFDDSTDELIILRLRASCTEEIGKITERHNP